MAWRERERRRVSGREVATSWQDCGGRACRVAKPALLPDSAVKLSVHAVTSRACARSAPARPPCLRPTVGLQNGTPLTHKKGRPVAMNVTPVGQVIVWFEQAREEVLTLVEIPSHEQLAWQPHLSAASIAFNVWHFPRTTARPAGSRSTPISSGCARTLASRSSLGEERDAGHGHRQLGSKRGSYR